MRVNSFAVHIIDTLENDKELVFEKTQLSAPKLVYNGSQDKFQSITTSELQFNFLVKDNTAGKFFDLYTGSETRYRVALIDTSVVGFPKTLWSGFLLPEQFVEPYTHSNFFVEFVATDGLGRLRSKPFTAVSNKVSVLQVISDCLLKTGLALDVYFSEAIQSAAFTIDYLDITVNTDAYKDDKGNYKTAYDVLESCLVSIGARLFLYNNAWYIIGLNRFKETEFAFYKYTLDLTLDLEFDSKLIYTRDVITDPLEATPSVSILPSLQKVITTWQAENVKNLVPEDIITHLPVNIDTDIDDRTLKYWSLETDSAVLFKVWLILATDFDYSNVDFDTYYNGFKATPNYKVDESLSGPFVFFNTSGLSLSDLDTNFGYLTTPVFIYGSDDLERYGSLEIEFEALTDFTSVTSSELIDYLKLVGDVTSVANNGSGDARLTCVGHGLEDNDVIEIAEGVVYSGVYNITKIDADTFDIDFPYSVNISCWFKLLPFKDQFKFAITRKDHLTETLSDEVMYLSNFDDVDIPLGMYDFDISFANNKIKGTLKIDKIAFTEDGFYNLRIYPIVDHNYLDGLIIYTKLNFNLNIDSEYVFEQKKDIDFTTVKEVDVFHSSSRMGLSERVFDFSDTLTTAISNQSILPGLFLVEPISFSSVDVNASNGQYWYTSIKVVVGQSEVNSLQNGYSLYVIKQGESTLEEVVNYTLSDVDNSITQLKFPGNTGVFIEATDSIYLQLGSDNQDLNYANFWLDKFKRYDVVESRNFYECVNSVYHDLLHEYNYKVNGLVLGLVGPLDVVSFSFKGEKQLYPTDLEINLSEGKTELTMIETKNENVTDYAE